MSTEKPINPLIQILDPIVVTLYTGKQAYLYKSNNPAYNTSDEISLVMGWMPIVGLRAIMSWFALEVDFSNASPEIEKSTQLLVQSWPGNKRVQSQRILYVLTRDQVEAIIRKNNSMLADTYKEKGLDGVLQARLDMNERTSYIYMFLDTDTMVEDNIVIKLGMVADPEAYLLRVKRQSGRGGLLIRKLSKRKFISDTANVVAKALLEKYKAYEITSGWFRVPLQDIENVIRDVHTAGDAVDVVVEVDEVPVINGIDYRAT